jgi:uncharacterized paraquat-inducible protein A
MIQCPHCGTNLSTAKIIAISELHCPGCNSRLKVSGIYEASVIASIISILTIFPLSLPLYLTSSLFVGWVFVILVRRFAKVTIAE